MQTAQPWNAARRPATTKACSSTLTRDTRNGLRDGRQAVTEARVIADNLGLVTVEIAGKDGIHYMSNDDFHERLPVCGAGANVEPERLVRSEKKDATCRGCLGESRAWFRNAK